MTREALTRQAAEALCGEVPRSTGWKAGYWTLTRDGISLLVKDVRYSAAAFRYTLGRILLRREANAYRRLDGLPFVPRYFGRLDADAIVLEKVDAPPLTRFGGEDLDPEFYDRLEACVAGIHDRGVVHLDLRHRSNILVAPGGRPMIIDFASALCLGTGRFARKVLLPLFGEIDFSGVLKYRLRDIPGRATEEDWRRHRRYRRLHLLWPFDRIYRNLRGKH